MYRNKTQNYIYQKSNYFANGKFDDGKNMVFIATALISYNTYRILFRNMCNISKCYPLTQ